MLQHIECPRCQAPNLGSEVCCFACGARLKPLPKRLGGPPRPAPWPLWIGLLVILGLASLLSCQLVAWLAGYGTRAGFPAWYLPAAGVLMIVGGQVAFSESRRRDARSWHLRRAPQLPLSQAHTGDAVWARGKAACDSAIVPAYFPQECCYYRYVVRERDPGEGGWRVTDRDSKAVDFTLVDDAESVYVPSGCVRFDAPLYVETFLNPEGTIQVKLWAIPVGLPVSLCGRIAGETARPRVDPLEEDLPAVVTWRTPQDYVAMLAKQARGVNLLGWALIVLGALGLIAGLVRT